MNIFNLDQIKIINKAYSEVWVSGSEIRSINSIKDRSFSLMKDFGKAILIGAGSIIGVNLISELLEYRKGKLSEAKFKARLQSELKDVKDKDQIIKDLILLEKDFNQGDGWLSAEDYFNKRNKILSQIRPLKSDVRKFTQDYTKEQLAEFNRLTAGMEDIKDNRTSDQIKEDARNELLRQKKAQENTNETNWDNYDKELEKRSNDTYRVMKDTLDGERRGRYNKKLEGKIEDKEIDKKANEIVYGKDKNENSKYEKYTPKKERGLGYEMVDSAAKGIGSSLGRHIGDAVWYYLSNGVKDAWKKFQDYRNKHKKDLEGKDRDKHIANLYRLKDAAYKAEENELRYNRFQARRSYAR